MSRFSSYEYNDHIDITKCNDFPDTPFFPNPLLFNVVAVANYCSYEEMLAISIRTFGINKVKYQGKIYTNPMYYPKELYEAIKNESYNGIEVLSSCKYGVFWENPFEYFQIAYPESTSYEPDNDGDRDARISFSKEELLARQKDSPAKYKRLELLGEECRHYTEEDIVKLLEKHAAKILKRRKK